jgi:aspartyl/glutamyl-tRNA(Asn/Gln) amidotransferase C subunit
VNITPERLRAVAALARLDLDRAELAGLAGELSRILQHAEALGSVVPAPGKALDSAAPGEAPLRDDEPGTDAGGLTFGVRPPYGVDGFFAVPRLASHLDDGGAVTDPEGV